jgi:hypothetical protein
MTIISTAKRIITLQKFHMDSSIWHTFPALYDGTPYHLVVLPLSHTQSPQSDISAILNILDELDWESAIFIAQGPDCPTLRHLALYAPQRVSGLFLIDEPETALYPPGITVDIPTLNVSPPGLGNNFAVLSELLHAFATLHTA